MRSTFVKLENANGSSFTIGLFVNIIILALAVPAKAYPSTRSILLWARLMVDMFCRPAKANGATVVKGVFCMDKSLRRGRPRNANGLIVVMLLPSSVNLRSIFKPPKASLLMSGKLFFVNESCSTAGGKCLTGISCSPPVLHNTWN